MLTYNDFCSLVKGLDLVESVTGKRYSDIHVEGDFVSFRRENSEKPEVISLKEMYRMATEQALDDITTSMAKSYISGRVQSPAVAIIRQACINGRANYTRNKRLKGVGCAIAIIAMVIGIAVAALRDDAIPFDAHNVPCVVNTDDIVVFDSESLDKVAELIYNGDRIALSNLMLSGVCATVKSGTKATYLRYLKDDYCVVNIAGYTRPAIIPRSRLFKY